MIFHMLVIEELRFQEVTIQESQFLNVTQLSDCRTYDLPFTLCRSCLLSHKVQMARIDWVLTVSGFSGGSDNKGSICSVGDSGSFPESVKSPGEQNGTHSSILAWRIPRTEESGRLQSRGYKKSDMTEQWTHVHQLFCSTVLNSQSEELHPILTKSSDGAHSIWEKVMVRDILLK